MTKERIRAIPETSRRRFLQGTLASTALAGGHSKTVAHTVAQQVSSLPGGYALVTSPRLPLYGIGDNQVTSLIDGTTTDWIEVGSPISAPVTLLALDGHVPTGSSPQRTFATYDEIANAMLTEVGSVAILPIAEIDFRVSALSVDNYDPLRQTPVDEEEAIQISVVGDIVPGRNVHNKMVEYGDFLHPFRKIAPVLSASDVTFANLEGNLSWNITPPADAHTFSFVSDPTMIEGFTLAGIDAVSLANNHSTWNSAGWGVSALLDTIDVLDAAGMGRFGGGRDIDEARAPWVTEVKGKSVALIGIDGVTANEEPRADDATVWETWLGGPQYAGAGSGQPGTNPYILDTVLRDIEFLSTQYDIVIPYFHFGVEYVAVPPPWAVGGARAAIDVGATMVVTNHPHVIQGMEIHSGKPIVYSPGNFVFDQMFAVDVRQGLICEITLRGDRVVGLRFRGFEIEDFNQPRLMTAGENASQMDRFWQATDRLSARS